MMKSLYIALLFVAIAATAPANTITWTLSGVTFDDGGTVSGTFDYDTGTGIPTNFNINATTGSALPAFNWTPTNSSGSNCGGATCILFTSDATFPAGGGFVENRILLLDFNSGLTSAGGTVTIATNPDGTSSRDCLNCSPARNVTAGSVSAPVAQTIAFPAIPNQIYGVAPFAISAQAGSGLPVSFSSGAPTVCKVLGDLVLVLTPGTCSLTASQGGNSGIQPVSQANTFVVSQAAASGTLTQGPGSPFGSGTFFFTAMGDFNGDGFADIAAADQSGNLDVFLGSSSGTFTAAPNSPFPTGGSSPSSIALGDFNADGNLDIAVGNSSSGTVSIFLGDGAGNFTQPRGSPFSLLTGAQPEGMAVADFNGDGKLDIAIADFNNSELTILNGNGNGRFTLGASTGVGLNGPFALSVADFDEDGNPDVAVANSAGNNLSILFGDGAGSFRGGESFPAGNTPLGVVTGDFDGDGHADIAVANNGDSTVKIFLGDGSGNYRIPPGSPYATGGSPRGLAIADFNGDGIPDLVAASLGTDGVSVLLGDGNGAFSQAPGSPFGAGSNPVQVSVGDVNGDGREDVAVANFASDNITVLLGTTTATTSTLSTTSPANILSPASVPLTLTVADNGTAFNTLTGTVTFFDNGATIGTASQTTSPYTFTANSPAVGTHVYLANYSGGAGSAASGSNTVTIAVFRAQTITFNAPPTVTIGVAPFNISATASSGLTVGFASNTTPVCTVTGTTVTAVSAGTCSITASQAGNGTFAAATPVTQTFTVLQTQTITFNALPNVTIGVAPFTIGATATSGLTVSFTSNTIPVCTVSGTTVTAVSPGTCSIAASQAGNGTFAAATPVTQTFTVLQTQTITFNALPNVSIGVAPFTITATASSGLTVSFASNTTSVCTVSGTTVTAVSPGTCSVTASQAGNGVFAAAAPVTQMFTVLQTQTITFNSLPNVNQGAAPFTVGATASSGLTVIFASNSTNMCTVNVATVSVLTAGTCSITASQAGNAVYAAAAPVTQMFNVLAPETITLHAIPNQIFGTPPFALSVEASSLLPVTLTSQTPAICTTASVLVTLVKPGTCTIQASQSGNNNFQPATSVMKSFTVTAANASGTFNPEANPFSAGTNPYSVAAGDFNGDGNADLAVANNGGNSVTVLLGDGKGGFTAAANSPFAVGTQPQSVVTGDFNGDGNQDLAIANAADNTVTILLGDGHGGFAPGPGSPNSAGTNPVSLAVGDFNGDGIQDLAVADSGGSTTSLLLGLGNGGFTLAPGSPVLNATNPASVAVGDFNGDGIPDLAIASAGDNTVSVLFGNGTGGFTAAPGSPVAVGTGPASVVVGDFNGDGFADFATANLQSNNVTVMLGDGAGHFARSAGSPQPVGMAPRALTVFDFNGDKIQDLAVANSASNFLTVLVGDGRGNFAAPSTSPFGAGTAPYAVAAADFNGDGREDLAVANEGAATVSVLVGAVVPPPPPPPGLTISVSPNPVNTAVGGSVKASFNAGGGTGGYKFTVSGLPAGVTVSGSGLTGTATQAGTFTATFTVTDSAGDVAVTSVTINVLGLTTTSLPNGMVGQPYAATLSAAGGSAAYSFAATGLPGGISLSSAGNLGGAPTSAATFTVSVSVTSGGVTATGSLSLTIAKATPVTISNAALPSGKVNVQYAQGFSATGGVPPYTWALSAGTLPPGLSLNSAGVVSGTPTTAGTYAFGVMATDTSGGTAVASASINIQAAPLQVTTGTLPSGMFGVPYPTQQLTVNGGVAPFTFAVTSGVLPGGLTLSSDGILSGTPQAGGTTSSIRPALIARAADGGDSFSVTAAVTDAAGSQTTFQIPLAIRQPAADLILTQGTLSFALVNPASSAPPPQVVGIQSTDPTQIIGYTLAVNPSVPWLNVTNGSMTPDSIQASIASAGLTLTPGKYNTSITATCTSSTCAGHTLSIAVTLAVTAAPPLLQVSTNLLSFATTNTSTGTLSGTINISNAGGGTLGFAAVSCEAGYCTAGAAPQNLAGGVSATIPVTINPFGLAPAFYRTQVDISSSGGKTSVPVTLFLSANATLALAPSGTQFNQLQGTAPGNPFGSFLVAVNSPSPVTFNASIASIQNVAAASWLVLQTGGGTASSSQPGSVIFAIDPAAAAQLPAGVYYAIVQVSSSGVSNSPQDYEVVLNVAPVNTPVAPEPQPAGLLFIQSGNGVPAPQVVNVYSASSQPATYQASASTTTGGNWLSVTPGTGSSSSTMPGVSTVSVDTSKLGPGVYYGGISYSLSATAVRTVNVTLIVPAAGLPSAGAATTSLRPANTEPRAVSCTPTKLVPAQTGLVNSFSQPAGWPTPLAINLADDCGNLIGNGRIVASFTNGDPPLILPLADPTSALYSGTWAPAHATSQITININASAQGFQNATSQISGAVPPNAVPVISPNATLHVFDPLVGGALAPGTIIAIYGNFLASSTSSATTIPLPTLYNDAAVTIGSFYAPIYYASPTQLNVQVPFELTPGQQYDVFVSVAGKLSTPQPIQLADVAPGLAAYTSGGLIAQHQADGSLITATSPAVPGEYVQAYLAGLGATTVNVPSGDASPSTPLAMPSDMPSLMINGSSYPIYFVGLTPTLVGLYQIDFQVPPGLPAGNLAVSIMQNGAPSNQTTLPYQP